MIDDPSSDTLNLLSLGAILCYFDHDLLVALGVRDQAAIADLLASDQVTPASEATGAYRLREDIQVAALARLRAERPLDELTLHTHAFQYFLRQMPQAGPAESRLDNEALCFHHLGELFMLLAQRLEWQLIAEYVTTARAAGPRQPRHLHQLTLYEGYTAIRTQQYERGETILDTLIKQDDLESDVRMRALNGLAQSHQYQSHYDRALVWYQQLQSVAEKTGNQVYQGVALLNMGMIYNDLEYYDRALNLSMQSLQIFRALQDSSREAYALYQVGNNAMRLGRWQIARDHFEEAIKVCERLDMVGILSGLYWAQGLLHHLLGNVTASETAYRHALEISQSPAYHATSITMDSWLFLGFLFQTEGRWDDALAAYNNAIALAAQLRHEHALSTIHYRRGNLFQVQGRSDEALAAYRQSIEGIESLRAATEIEEIKIGLLGTTQQVYEAMVLHCLDRDQPADAFNYVERARSRAFLDTLIKKSPELYASLAQPVATLAEIQAQLPEGALLLEYFTTGVMPRGESLINQLPPENTRLREHLSLVPNILIFAVTRDNLEVHRAALDPNSLRPHPDDPGPGRRLLHDRLLVRLHQALIAPVGHLLRERDLLYIIPHGPLHYVPFMALRSPGGEYLLAEDGPAIALAPSATILLRNCLARPTHRAEGLLTLGYNDSGAGALRYAEAEARHIAYLGGGTVWAGSAPKSERLIAEGRRARWLHIAGHAIYDLHDPLDSHLRLGADDTLSARAMIGGLDLNADLVTLSACTSGLTHVVPGDELLGLQRALLYAGAPTVVCTLWEAYDFIALLVMDCFYTDLLRGRLAAMALRDAQVALRRMTGRDVAATIARWRAEYPESTATLGDLPEIPLEHYETVLYADPFYWAPFMLIGRAG